MDMGELKDVHRKNRRRIREFLEKTKNRDREYILQELFFTMLTSQTRAANCRASVDRLKQCRDLFEADMKDIRGSLEGVRFADRKSEFLFNARKEFPMIRKNFLLSPEKQREWLVNNVKGMGMKLSSHFLRNVGVHGLAILDMHVQRFMKDNWKFHGRVGKLTKQQYLENEREFFALSRKLGIPQEELDIVIWMLGNKSGNFYG